MKDLTKMMIFMFLGLVFAILVLGFHKSGELGTHTQASIESPGPATTLAHPYYARTELYRFP